MIGHGDPSGNKWALFQLLLHAKQSFFCPSREGVAQGQGLFAVRIDFDLLCLVEECEDGDGRTGWNMASKLVVGDPPGEPAYDG